MTSQLITKPDLDKIRKGGQLILESQMGKEIPMLWLFYDFNTSSYVLVRRAYDNNKTRSFNHVILDDSYLENYSSQINAIFLDAIKKIKEGECFVFEADKTFVKMNVCNKPHS